MVEAARNGHLSTVKLLREFGRKRDECCLTARAVAEATGHVKVARWLDESDPDLFRALQEAVSDWRIDGANADAQAMAVQICTDGRGNTDGGEGRYSELMEGCGVGEEAVGVEISTDGENVEESGGVGSAQAVGVEISFEGGGRSTIKRGGGASGSSVEGDDGAEGENGRCRARCHYRRGRRRSVDGGSGVESGEEECSNNHRQQQGWWGGFDDVVDASEGCVDVVPAERNAAAAIGGGEAVVYPPRTGLVIAGRTRVTGGGNSLVSSRDSSHESSREAFHGEGTHSSSYHAGTRASGRGPRASSLGDATQDTTRCKKPSGGVGTHHDAQISQSTVRVGDCPPRKSRANASTTAVIRARHKKTVSSSSPQQFGGTNGTQSRLFFMTRTGAATPPPLTPRRVGFLVGGGVAIACCLVLLVVETISTMAGGRQQEP